MATALDTHETTFLIEEATPEDTDFLLLSLCALHDETRKFGGVVATGEKTLSWINASIQDALAGNGVALVVRDEVLGRVGALVASELRLPYSHNLGRVASGNGVYVNPLCRKMGIATALYERAKAILTARGFDNYTGGRLVENVNTRNLLREVGFQDLDITVVCRLGSD